ncbi:MAG: hypothetical protein M0027_01540 [Candidatus Dormibacteraeota bacterium]|nr:hypothetical protein [Candidatus Dormibacteraeota bacterium]
MFPILGVLSLLLASLLTVGATDSLFSSTPVPGCVTVGTSATGAQVSTQKSPANCAAPTPTPTSTPTPPATPTPTPASQPVSCTHGAQGPNLATDPYFGVTTSGPTQQSPGTSTAAVSSSSFEQLVEAPSQMLSSSVSLPSTIAGFGTDTANGITGTGSDPVSSSGNAFAFGYCDETQFHEFDPSTPATCSSGTTPPTSPAEVASCLDLPGGVMGNLTPLGATSTVTVPDGYSAQYESGTSPPAFPSAYPNGYPGLPFVEIYTTDQFTAAEGSNPVPLSGVAPAVAEPLPVNVLYQSYTPTATGGPGSPGTQFAAVLDFQIPAYDICSSAGQSGCLSAGSTYVAYLLISDTDGNGHGTGPLADHAWYFTVTGS